MSVRFTPTGRAQFLAAIGYIRRENPTAAARFAYHPSQPEAVSSRSPWPSRDLQATANSVRSCLA